MISDVYVGALLVLVLLAPFFSLGYLNPSAALDLGLHLSPPVRC